MGALQIPKASKQKTDEVAECTTNNIDTAFAPLATFLRDNKRTAFVTETGAGNTDSCLKAMCEQLDFLK
jgi:endoglucanase